MKLSEKRFFIASVLTFIIFCVSACSLKGEGEFALKDHLDDVVLKINDAEFTFGDLGYYIANGEAAVEAQALVYNQDNPMEYWNKHTNGIFIKVQTSQNVLDNFIRDAILAIEAKNQGLSLSDAEKENCKTAAEGMFGQLSSFQKEAAGITLESLQRDIENAYLGQIYVTYKLANDGSDDYTASDWQLDGVCYKGLLSQYKIKIENKNWEKAEFGKMTIER